MDGPALAPDVTRNQQPGPQPQTSQPWVGRAILEGVVFALAVALLSASAGPLLASRLAEATRQPSCSDSRELVRLQPITSAASSSLTPEVTKEGRRLNYEHRLAIDGDTGTAWVEGKPGLGQGEWIEFTFPRAVKPELICIVNGYALMWDLYQKNPRVRGILVTASEQDDLPVVLLDAGTPDRVAVFQDVKVRRLRPNRTIRLTVTSLYAASGRERYEDTSLSEIEFWGAP